MAVHCVHRRLGSGHGVASRVIWKYSYDLVVLWEVKIEVDEKNRKSVFGGDSRTDVEQYG